MNTIQYENYQEKKEHGPAPFPYITYPCSIPLDFPGVPLHWHDEMELIYIKKGQGVVTVEYTAYHVRGGDILVIVPGRLHAIDQEPGASMEYENIIFQPSLLLSRREDLCGLEFLEPMFRQQLAFPEYLPAGSPAHRDAAACLDLADRLCRDRPRAYQLGVKSALFAFFFSVFSRETEGSENRRPPLRRSLDKTKQILKYIELNYGEKLTIKEMAEASGFSQSHFMKFFKSAFGRPFIPFLREYRLTMTARMLLSSGSSILEIAQQTGFENLSYFNRSFKAAYGMTPSQFRARGARQAIQTPSAPTV